MLAFGGGGGLISASEYIERLEGLIRKHACPPVQEEDGWECPLCAWMEEEVRDEI